MPRSTVALALLLGIALLQPPCAEAVRRMTKRGDDDGGADEDDDSNDTDENSSSKVENKVSTAAATVAPAKSIPASLVVKTKRSAANTTADDDDDDSDDKDDDDSSDAESDTHKAPEESAELKQLKASEKTEQDELMNVEAQLDANQIKQTKAKTKLADVTDPAAERASDAEIAKATKDIQNETQSAALGKVLGKMWKEMRMYAGPYYTEHLGESIKKLQAEEATLSTKETHLRATLATTRDELEANLGHHDKPTSAKVVEDAEPQPTEAPKEDDKAEKPKESSTNEDDDAENRVLHLGLWFAGIIALVAIVFVLARRGM